MSRDRLPAGYLHLTELQPALLRPPTTSQAVPYEGNPAPPEIRKRRASHFVQYDAASAPPPAPRRRKPSSYGTNSAYDDDGEEVRSRTLPDKKQNHSEIEKRRRDKMNTYISELAAMVPMCGAMARKLDKLTVLRMAVQHLRAVRGALATGPLTACPRPPYVRERELNELVLAAGSRAALLVVGCCGGRLLYVSRSAAVALRRAAPALLGQSLFDILHPKDVSAVKEQLSPAEPGPRERLVDARTMLPLRTEARGAATTLRLCPGARRSFLCRVRCEAGSGEREYRAVQCTGYLKAWDESGAGGDDDTAGRGCLVAVARALPDLAAPPARVQRFLSRHAADGRFLFVDQRVALALGFLPQELVGTSLYERVEGAELAAVARAHKAALVRPRQPAVTPPYRARRKDGSTVLLQTHFKPCRNPWTKEVECLLAQHTLVSAPEPCPSDRPDSEGGEGGEPCLAADSEEADADAEVQRLIDSQVESHKIGSAIAEEALRRSPATNALELPPELLHDALFSAAGEGAAGVGLGDEGGEGAGEGSALDGNGEAAMAVIMSLLEADAGLGGPVNFSGLPWPLP